MGDKSGNKVGNKNAVAGSKEAALIKMQVRILVEIRNNSNITKARIMEKLEVGKTTVDTGISALKKFGYIERVGSNKSGYWKILK
ncbi:MAG: HTH domain-containing protein [Lachnospiraceae bacterium]|nr:HTH domain-containing protein [Lachnospiraceae bacterium]